MKKSSSCDIIGHFRIRSRALRIHGERSERAGHDTATIGQCETRIPELLQVPGDRQEDWGPRGDLQRARGDGTRIQITCNLHLPRVNDGRWGLVNGKRMTVLNFSRLAFYHPHVHALYYAILTSKTLSAIPMGDSRLQELDDDVNTEKHLRLLMASAAESGLTRKVAQAHYCTGEYFLSKVRIHCVESRS